MPDSGVMLNPKLVIGVQQQMEPPTGELVEDRIRTRAIQIRKPLVRDGGRDGNSSQRAGLTAFGVMVIAFGGISWKCRLPLASW